MAGDGFVKVDRRIIEHPKFGGKPYSEGWAWLWMITAAAWKDEPPLKRGQLSHSVRFMAAKFGWHRSKVERFLASLKAETMIETATETGETVITICNYDKYQNNKRSVETGTDTATETKKKKKKEIEEKKEKHLRLVEARPTLFDEFWKTYPKREGSNPKHPAEVKFAVAVKHGIDPLRIVAGARTYAEQVRRLKTEPRFVAQAVTWLNQHRWEDAAPSGSAEEESTEVLNARIAEMSAKIRGMA